MLYEFETVEGFNVILNINKITSINIGKNYWTIFLKDQRFDVTKITQDFVNQIISFKNKDKE